MTMNYSQHLTKSSWTNCTEQDRTTRCGKASEFNLIDKMTQNCLVDIDGQHKGHKKSTETNYMSPYQCS